MDSELILYDEKYNLNSYETLFMQHFKDTHSLNKSLKLLNKSQQEKVNSALRTGKSDLALAFKEFIESAPTHPEANKVVILDNLVWIMNQAKEDKDTNGVLRAISEINKMIKGNLVSSNEKQVIQKQLVGIIDLTRKDKDNDTIDVEYTEM